MQHVMIDLETLGTNPDTVVLSLGAVKFDVGVGQIGERIHYYLDIDHQLAEGRTVTGPTIRWWMAQSEQARSQFLESEQVYFKAPQTLDAFDQFFEGAAYIWSHGSNFDTVILDNMYQQYGRRPPWRFQNVRDTRTLLGLIEDKNVVYDVKNLMKPNKVVAHNALLDAYNQAQAIRLALAYLQGRIEEL